LWRLFDPVSTVLTIATIFDLEPVAVCAAVKRQRESLRNPPKSALELLATLERHGLPQTVARFRGFLDLI
jgi:hypothetical protein